MSEIAPRFSGATALRARAMTGLVSRRREGESRWNAPRHCRALDVVLFFRELPGAMALVGASDGLEEKSGTPLTQSKTKAQHNPRDIARICLPFPPFLCILLLRYGMSHRGIRVRVCVPRITPELPPPDEAACYLTHPSSHRGCL